MNKGLKLVLYGAGAILTAGVATGIYIANKNSNKNVEAILKSKNTKKETNNPHPNLDEETFEQTFERIFGEPPRASDYPEDVVPTKEENVEKQELSETENFYEVVNMIKEFTNALENNKNLSDEEKAKLCREYEEKFKEAMKTHPDAYSSYTLKNMINFAEAGDALFDKNANSSENE